MTAKESLEALIKDACSKSKEFSSKYEYWMSKRCKTPDIEWFLTNLTKVLGKKRIQSELNKITKE